MSVSTSLVSFCQSCGARLGTNGAQFCGSCGTAIVTPPGEAVPTPATGLPKENIISVFRKPTSAAHAAKKRAWAFSSSAVFAGVGLLNLLVAAANGAATNSFLGVMGLVLAISLVGQGLLLLGYTEG